MYDEDKILDNVVLKKHYITVTWQFEGTHYYPDAGKDSSLKDVSFLAHEHRHMFHCSATIEVHGIDRELEFIQVKRDLKNRFGDGCMDNMSCEMIAEEIVNYMASNHPYNFYDRDVMVSVFEDNENGSYLEAYIMGVEYENE